MTAPKDVPHPDAKQHLHYVHTLDYSLQERIVGLFVLGGLALLFLAMLFNQHSAYLFEDTFTISTRVSNAEGISTSTRINASGVEIGRVSDISIDDASTIVVTMQIRERFHGLIRKDSQAQLNSLSVFGTTTIDIVGGSDQAGPIADGDSIHLQERPSINALIGEFIPVVQNLAESLQQLADLNEGGQTLRQLMEDIASTVSNLREVSVQLSQGQGVAGRLLHDEALGQQMADSVSRVDHLVRQAEQRLNELQPILHNTQSASEQFEPLLSQLGQLQASIAQMLQQLRGELDSAPGIAQDTQQLLQDTQRSIDAVQGLWPLSGAISRQDSAAQDAHAQHTLPPVE